MDCEDHVHVVPPVKFLEPCDSNQSAASLTLHENDASCSCAVDFWHIVVKPRRRKTTRTYYRFWKSRWNKESVCDASGLGGFVRRYLSTRSLRITSNFFRCTMYLASHSVLCHCLVKQHSRNDKKKKKKKKKKIVRCQCTTKLTQMSSFSESHPSHGRARHQIRD